MPTSETTRPPQDEAAVPEALRAACERLGEVADAYEKAEPDWLGHALLDQVRLGLDNLRRYIDDPDEDRISWDFPFVELTYPVEWDFEGRLHRPPGGVVFGTFTAEDVVDGKVSEEKVLEVLYETRQLEALSRLTRRVVEWREAGKTDAEGRPAYILPQDLVAWLDETTGTTSTEKGVEGPPEAVEARRRLVDHLARPFSVGAFEAEAAVADAKLDAPNPAELEALVRSETPLSASELSTEEWVQIDAGAAAFEELEKDRPDIPPLNFTATSDAGETLEGSVVALVYPLVVDATARRAWFPLGVGLVFTKGDPRRFPEKDLAELWEGLTKPDAGETPRSETSTRSTTSARSAPRAGPPQARVLQDSRVRMDALAVKAVGFFGDVKLWRKWDNVKTWPALVQDEVARIREAHGEAAFEDAPGIRGPLLRRTWTAKSEELVELTKEAEEDLLECAGRVGFRRVKRDPDRIEREYLVKRVPAGRGALTLSFTWYGQAFPLSHEARAEEEKRLRAEKARDAVALFPASEDERRKRDRALELLGSMRDAARIAPRLLTAFYQQRANPIHLPVWELYLALGCETDPHRFSRVNAALETLRRLDYEYEADGLGPELSGRVRGSFVTEIGQSAGRGAGAHRDVDFYVTLSTWAIGCLQVFKQAGGRLKDPRRVFYDWTAKLEKDERKALNYVQGFSALASYYDAAAGLTPAQSRLRTWMEDQLTRRSDATAKGRKAHRVNPSAADAGEPRVYTSDFCPLLEKDRGYHAALGHFPQANNAETGRTLRGRSQGPTTTGGPRSGGLLEALGYELPPGRAVQAREAVAVAALKDLRAVVEEYLGGRVVGRRGGVWLSLHEAERIRAEELLGEVSWFLFLPEDWLARAQRTFEDHHRRRYERGETDRPVRVTTSNAPATDAASAGEVGLDAAELRVRLHAKRRERELTSDAVGKVFGVSKMTVSNWERGRDAGGAPIPEDLQPLILRWIDKGEGPTEDELKALAARRRGGKKRASP